MWRLRVKGREKGKGKTLMMVGCDGWINIISVNGDFKIPKPKREPKNVKLNT